MTRPRDHASQREPGPSVVWGLRRRDTLWWLVEAPHLSQGLQHVRERQAGGERVDLHHLCSRRMPDSFCQSRIPSGQGRAQNVLLLLETLAVK